MPDVLTDWQSLVQISLVVLFLDVIFGILIALRNSEFDIRELPGFLKTDVLPYLLGIIVLGMAFEITSLGMIETGVMLAAVGAWTLKIVADLIVKVRKLFSV